MKVLRAIGICMLLVAAGFMLTGCLEVPEPDQVILYEVQPGDTLNGIAAEHFKYNKPGLMSLDDYQMHIRVTNNKLHNLERQLQIGDMVKVPVYTK